jgi:sugar-phosphatase
LHDIGVGATGKAVLFDVDGVLVDSYPAYRRIWSRWATHRNLDPDLVWSHTHGRRPIATITVVAPQLDADAEYRLVRDIMAQKATPSPCTPTPPRC